MEKLKPIMQALFDQPRASINFICIYKYPNSEKCIESILSYDISD
jgi:hypothetical protein